MSTRLDPRLFQINEKCESFLENFRNGRFNECLVCENTLWWEINDRARKCWFAVNSVTRDASNTRPLCREVCRQLKPVCRRVLLPENSGQVHPSAANLSRRPYRASITGRR